VADNMIVEVGIILKMQWKTPYELRQLI